MRIEPNGDFVDFLVSDDGPGLEPDEAERVYQPRFPGTAGSTDESSGAAHSQPQAPLARAVGGDVVAADNGAGGSFRVRIPSARG